jgi:predicted acetyltransferase
MSEIRIVTEDEYPEVIRIAVEAYPSMGVNNREGMLSWEKRFKTMARDKSWTPYGVFRDGKMVGIYRNFDFTMNVRGNLIPAGGLGMVAVDLTHKKEHIAKEIVESFLTHYHRKGEPMTTLWPFRLDFYHHMGFGFGGKRFQYRINPATLPLGKSKEHIRYLTEKDIPALVECYHRIFEKQNGMLAHSEARWQNRFDFMEKLRFIGCEIDGRLEGYLVYSFKTPAHPGSFMDSEMVVNELFYHSPQALSELLAFLHTQFDQVSVLTLETSEDEFYFLMEIPAIASGAQMSPTYHESHMSGLGIMYRVMDLERLFKALEKPSFGDDRLTIKINLRDTLLPQNQGARVVHFEGGLGTVVDDKPAEVAISLDVAEFSSMLIAAVGFRKLHTYGLATISDPTYIDRIDRLFAYAQKPVCVTPF